MARSRSPVPRRSPVSPDIFWEPLSAEEIQACRVLRKSCSDAPELIEDFSPSCEDSSDEVVEEVSPSTCSGSDGVQPASTAMPACVRERLQEEPDLVNYSAFYKNHVPWLTVSDSTRPPETFNEVLPVLSRKVKPYAHLIASDQGTGLNKAWTTLKVQAATA
ncbi:unnamed protein product, partial [Symbiodinium microadriaticum]